MKKVLLFAIVCLSIACSENNQKKIDDAISRTSDSLVAKLNKANDTLKNVTDSIKNRIPKIEISSYKEIPISLQWIGFNNPGKAKVNKATDGWYSINGEQTNANNEYVKINGKIKRIDANQLSFDGVIITYMKSNNGGKPCEKTGAQIFLKKGDRKYYRLQRMENCEGGN